MVKKLLPIALCLFCLVAFADDDKTKKTPAAKKASKKEVLWQDDPVCRMVFFAVLEGLYKDGVSDEVVDYIVPDTKEGDDEALKKSFVFACPLCHPVFEAFRLYKGRKPFVNSKTRKTFGKGVDAKIIKGLSSKDANTKLSALSELLSPWIARRLKAMRLTEAELTDWNKKISQRASEGKNKLMDYQAKGAKEYKGWSIYLGCAACNASKGSCDKVLREKKSKKDE